MSTRFLDSARSCALCVAALAGGAMVPRAFAQVPTPEEAMPNGRLGGFQTDAATHDAGCVTPAMAARVQMNIAMFVALHGPLSQSIADVAPPLRFWPLGGTLYRDLNMGNFVDLDPTPGVLSYLCDQETYDGHNGIDCGSPWWSQVDIGMPIYAAADGTVIDAHDGEPDRNTACVEPPNYVIIDHGNGRICWYLHMKTSSVAVNVNQQVKAGQQIGLVASSGCSFGPHLHFQVMDSGNVFEPFAGACRAGPSGWANQIDPPATGAYLKDFGVTAQDIGAAPPSPARPPVDAQMAYTDPLVYFWINTPNFPANSTWSERYIRPDGSLYLTLGPFNFNNSTNYGWALWWFSRNIPEMRIKSGTWRIQLDINGVQLVDAPVEVVPTRTPGFNRSPLPISVAFDPPAPVASDAMFARVTSDPGIRDLDWDLVRYRYVWKKNGITFRDVVSAGMADAIPAGTAAGTHDVVACTITPNDGHVDGASVTIAVAVGCYANCDANTSSPVLSASDFICFLNRFRAGDAYANCDASTGSPTLTAGDFTCFLQKFRAGCP